MGYEWDNDCVGCERCINCGRGDYKAYYCDDCGNYETKLYKGLNGEDLCWDCFINQYESRVCEADEATVCANCGNEEDILYFVNGEWVCEDCLKGMTERVDTN